MSIVYTYLNNFMCAEKFMPYFLRTTTETADRHRIGTVYFPIFQWEKDQNPKIYVECSLWVSLRVRMLRVSTPEYPSLA